MAANTAKSLLGFTVIGGGGFIIATKMSDYINNETKLGPDGGRNNKPEMSLSLSKPQAPISKTGEPQAKRVGFAGSLFARIPHT